MLNASLAINPGEADSSRRAKLLGLWIVPLVLTATLGLRLIQIDQPIVENYVGRQIPTAMVARNLERGSGFGHPSLDVAPFPNRFLVEPPVYAAAVVLLRNVTGLSLDRSGRAVSAIGITLAAWGLFGLVARRLGERRALAAIAIFAIFPVTIRYGRAFHPDALMLGCLLAGLRFWDDADNEPRGWSIAAAWIFTALGLALKITSSFVFVPLIVVIFKQRRRTFTPLALTCLVPALVWYVWVFWQLRGEGSGSRASADNGRIWLQVLVPWSLLRASTYLHVIRFLGIRAFTPLGPPLALYGLWIGRKESRLWIIWGLAAVATLAALSAKLHHEYYMLILAPVMAVGLANAFENVYRWRWLGSLLVTTFVIGCGFCAASTWSTPREWIGINEAGAAIRAVVPESAWIVAPEALLYGADRKGCRLEFTAASAARAAREWGVASDVKSPMDLIAFYRKRGALYFADLAFDGEGRDRLALHNAVRGRYKIVIDRPGLLLVRLTDPEP